MGTRNLTIVKLANDVTAIAQYGQWDGYPSGQGLTALEFVRDKMNQEKFVDRLRTVHWLTKEEIRKGYADAGNNTDSDWITEEIFEKFNKAFPFLTRDHGAKILELVQESSGPINLVDHSDFADDSLFCEWAYVIDLDEKTFEVYKGFNQKPLGMGERFAYLSKRNRKSNYYPIKHARTWSLDALPTNAEFIAKVKE